MREEASLAGNDEGGGPSVAHPPDAPGLPSLSDLQQPPKSPSPRFEFYTDPLAAFSGSQRNKKSRNSFDYSFGGAPPREASASPFTPPSRFSPSKHNSYHQPNLQGRPQPGMVTAPGHLNPNVNNYPDFNHNATPHVNLYPSSTPPRCFSTPSPVWQSSPGSSSYGSRSAPYNHNYNHNGTIYMNSPAPSYYNGGRGSHSAQSPQRHGGGMEIYSQSHGSNLSWGSFKQSPGSSSRGTPRGGRGGYRPQGRFSEATPQSYAKRSMLEDPWKDLVPVRIESVAFRLDSCSVSGSRDWLPKTASREKTASITKGLSVSTSGPSLAESLAASFADAVAEEDVASLH